MRLHCIRTNSVTGKETYEWHKARLRHCSMGVGWAVYLEPGVTGNESICLKDLYYRHQVTDWPACAGTPNSWDKLVVPKAEMERLIDILELLPV